MEEALGQPSLEPDEAGHSRLFSLGLSDFGWGVVLVHGLVL